MAKPQQSKSAAFVSGIALIFLIVSCWACVRLPWVWLSSDGSAATDGRAWIQLPEGLSNALFFMHLGLAAFTVYASAMMLRFRAWTRPYLMAVLLGIGTEAIVAAGWMAFVSEPVGETSELRTIRWVVAVAIFLLGCCAVLLAWKLQRDQGIRAVFEQAK